MMEQEPRSGAIEMERHIIATPSASPSDEGERGGDDEHEDREEQHGLLRPSLRRKQRKGVADFSLIDWVYEMEEHKRYYRSKMKTTAAEAKSPLRTWLEKTWLECHSWVMVLIIGMATGFLAGMIHTCVDVLRDLKGGVCHDAFWLAQKKCCPHQEIEHCEEWKSWGDYFAGHGIRASTSTYVLDYFVFLAISVFYGCLSAWLVRTFAPYAAGSGIPEIKTILSGVHIKRYLNEWTLLIKCLGVSLSVGSGLSLGMEGPFVHVASCVGNITCRFFKEYREHESKRREMISAAVAAGVSVAFGAPIGGVLFSLEEASYYFPHKTMWRSFFCAVIAALVLKRVDPSGTGRLVIFQVDYNYPWFWFELFPFAILGIVGGLVGTLFNVANLHWCKFRRSSALKFWPVAEVCAVVAITATLNFMVPYLHGGAGEFIAELFQECRGETASESPLCKDSYDHVLSQLAMAALVKMVLTIFTFGIKVPAGLFVPSLFTGACLGRMMGIFVQHQHQLHPNAYIFNECSAHSLNHNECVIPGIYAIVGAAAVLGGVTRMTISLVVIIFELTGGLEYLVPVMLAALISKWVGEWLGQEDSIYELHIEMNGYPYLDPKSEATLQATAADFMVSSNIQVITVVGWTVGDINQMLEGCNHSGFPVVMSHQDMRIVGFISRTNLMNALSQPVPANIGEDNEVLFYEPTAVDRHTSERPVLDISRFLDSTPICITPDTSVNRLLHIFKSLGVRTCLVSKNNKLVGIATRRGMINFMKRLREREHGH
eukprot:TRINITY_DN19078_c0_g1_i1.p1 TRINITY_DN19078_c0_g1~~TRINITY_DN19078_c0_g1_i1.p1  ORF type:complete len:770 (+),score=294.38 TRINITY_DN19078_c0_g1_i1:77-2386(+)